MSYRSTTGRLEIITRVFHQFPHVPLLRQPGVSQSTALQDGFELLEAQCHWIHQLGGENPGLVPDDGFKEPSQDEQHEEIQEQKEEFPPHFLSDVRSSVL